MKRTISNTKTLIFLTLIFALALAGCGSGSSNQINFTITDFAFTPGEFTVAAGQEITIHVTHNGSVTHNFIVMKYGTDAGHEFDEEDQPNVYWHMEIQPGETKTVVFTAPSQTGTYQILCGMPGHLQSGMVGKLIVTGPP